MNTTTEPPAELPDGVASPPPLGFTLVIWMGALSIVLWAMLFLFRRRVPRTPDVEPEE